MIMVGIDGRDWRTCRGFVDMCGILDEYCRDNACRLTCWLQWPGLWVAESTPAMHGVLQGYEMPEMAWDLLDRHASGVLSTLVLYQNANDDSTRALRDPLHCALPLKSNGVTVPQTLIECLPPHVVEEVQKRVKEINARLAKEIRELDRGAVHVGETEGRGDEGGCVNGHLSGVVRI